MLFTPVLYVMRSNGLHFLCPSVHVLRMTKSIGTNILQTKSVRTEKADIPHSLYLLYHELRPTKSSYSYVVETELFRKHVDLFRQIGKASNSYLHPELTFDDGHISNLEYALPILQSTSISAHFFITVGWTGVRRDYMDWKQLRELSQAGQMLGAHGWSHKLLTHCSDEELKTELRKSKAALEDNLGVSITTMSLPGGRYNNRVLGACEEAGYNQVFTSIPRSEEFPLGQLVGRLNIRGDSELSWVAEVLQEQSGTLQSLQRIHRRKELLKKIVGDNLYARFWALINREEQYANTEAMK